MDIYTIDFETYYASDYSLTKLTTEAYIRDPRFEVLMMSIKKNDDQVFVLDDPFQIAAYLRGTDWSRSIICAHHTQFDGAILAWHYGVKPRMWACTLSMARAVVGGYAANMSLKELANHLGLPAKGTAVLNARGKHRGDFTPQEWDDYKTYCAVDTNITRELYRLLRVGAYAPGLSHGPFPVEELVTIDSTIRMFTEPALRLDPFQLQEELARIREDKARALALAQIDVSELMSNPKFANALVRLGVEPPTKISPTTGKMTYAFAKTDAGMQTLAEHENTAVQALAAARLKVKSTLAETRTAAFIGVAHRGNAPIYLKYAGADQTQRACLTADTRITVLRAGQVLDILLPQLLPLDLVWDGEEFVGHGGLVDQGLRPVMSYKGLCGTPDHRIFVEEINGPIELSSAASRGYTPKAAQPYKRK